MDGPKDARIMELEGLLRHVTAQNGRYHLQVTRRDLAQALDAVGEKLGVLNELPAAWEELEPAKIL